MLDSVETDGLDSLSIKLSRKLTTFDWLASLAAGTVNGRPGLMPICMLHPDARGRSGQNFAVDPR